MWIVPIVVIGAAVVCADASRRTAERQQGTRLGQRAPDAYELARRRAQEEARRPTLAAAVARWYSRFVRDWGARGVYAVVEISPWRGGDPALAYGVVQIDQATSRPEAIRKMQSISRPQMPGWFLAVVGPIGIEASRPDGPEGPMVAEATPREPRDA